MRLQADGGIGAILFGEGKVLSYPCVIHGQEGYGLNVDMGVQYKRFRALAGPFGPDIR